MKQTIPDYQGVTIVTLFLFGSSLVFGLAKNAGSNLWISFLFGIIMASPLILIYARFRSLLPGPGLYQGLEGLYGSWLSRLITFLFGVYAWRIGTLESKDIAVFVDSVALNFTPQAVFVLSLAVLALWAGKIGLPAMGRWSAFVIKIVVIVVFIILILMGTQMDPNEFSPVLYGGWKPVLSGSLQLLDYPFLELIIALWVFEHVESKKSPYKIFLWGFIIGAFLLMLLSVATVAVIGEEKYCISYYPVFIAVSRISLFRFITRLEATVGTAFVITTFLKISMCLLATAKCFAHTLGLKNYKILVTPIAISIIPASQWLAKAQMEVYGSIIRTIAPYDFLMQVILPLMLWVSAEILVRLRPNKKGAKAP